MKKGTFVVILVLALFTLTATIAFAHSVNVTLTAQNGSGQNGTTQILDNGDGTSTVVVEVSNGTDTPQPAHIHPGTCANLDPKPVYPLNNVVNGKSTTVIAVDVDTLTDGTFAVNLHKSAAEASVYTSCGNLASAVTIEHSPGMPTTGSRGFDVVISALAVLGLTLLSVGLKFSRRIV